MSTTYYSAGKTLWKLLVASSTAGGGALATVNFPDEGADALQWTLFILGIIPPIAVTLRNWIIHHKKPRKGSVEHIAAEFGNNIYRGTIIVFLVATLAFLSSGCTTLGQSSVTTRFEEAVAPDGTTTTIFEAKSRGEVDASLHQLNYRWGGEENQIIVGQDASGITSPAQQALLFGLGDLIANVPGMWNALMGTVSRSPEAPQTP